MMPAVGRRARRVPPGAVLLVSLGLLLAMYALGTLSPNGVPATFLKHNRRDAAGPILNTSDLTRPGRRIWVVTTAALPWQTGTSINPTLRAAYLLQETPARKVTLVVPWLEAGDQKVVFRAFRFSRPADQAQHIRDWLDDADMPFASRHLAIMFYNGRYVPDYGSIFPTEDILRLIPDAEADVAVLEEPEHLNWFHPASDNFWRSKFQHVVGIIHTNYLAYSLKEPAGTLKTPVLYAVNRWMVGAHCHRVIKLSAVLQQYAPAKEVVSNVHGVREAFLEVGDATPIAGLPAGPYFIAKMLWQKGFHYLFGLMRYWRRQTKHNLHLDMYGGGPDEAAIKAEAAERGFNVTFHPVTPHVTLTQHKIMVNPSLSEVLCTATAEALAMGKFVVCPEHPSNEFFKPFANCLQYRSNKEFLRHMEYALSHDPAPLTPAERRRLTWQAATERFVEACQTPEEVVRRAKPTDDFLAHLHAWFAEGQRGKAVRRLATGSYLN